MVAGQGQQHACGQATLLHEARGANEGGVLRRAGAREEATPNPKADADAGEELKGENKLEPERKTKLARRLTTTFAVELATNSERFGAFCSECEVG
jgi:hypothetical protein